MVKEAPISHVSWATIANTQRYGVFFASLSQGFFWEMTLVALRNPSLHSGTGIMKTKSMLSLLIH